MDDRKKEFNADVDLDSLISYFNSDSDKKSSESKMNVNKDAIKKNSQEKKKFVVHIDENELNYSDSNSSKPSDNSSVYFSNYPKRKTNTRQKAPTSVKASVPSVKKKAKTVGGNFAVLLFAFIILFTTISSYVSISGLNDILAINTNDDVVKVEIPEEPTYNDIIDILHDNDLIKQKMLCTVFTKFRHYDDEDYKYLSGVYYLDRSMGVEGMLNKCMAAPESADTVTLGFPEGWTIKQIFEKLEKYDVCKTDRLYTALNDVDFEFDFVRSLTPEEERYQLLEGYIFPDTYDFYVDADANYVIRKFLSNFNDRWTDEYQARADKLGYTMDEIIIIASIIQKEAADSSQMKAVSSVIHNRLKNSVKFPTLGCDSTAIYVSNYVKPVVGGNKGNYYLSKYDTAANRGLPPGPICNPGVDAIKAALYPSDTNYYYFLHDNSGKIYMARTQQEHESNYVLAIKANNSN